jgi:hypothetical protein
MGRKWKLTKKAVEEEKKWLKMTRDLVKEGEKLLWMRKKVAWFVREDGWANRKALVVYFTFIRYSSL